MAKREILVGATSQTLDVFVQSNNGAPLTALVFNSTGLTARFRKGATGSSTALTLATQTVGGAYSSGGFVEIDATNMPGVYRLDLSNAMVDTAGMLTIVLNGFAGMAPTRVEIEVVAVDKFNATTMGLVNLDAAVSSRMATYTQPTGFLAASFPTDPADASDIAAATAAIQADTDNIQTRLPAALVGGRMAANAELVGDKTGYGLDLSATVPMSDHTSDATITVGGALAAAVAQAAGDWTISGTSLTLKNPDGTTYRTFTLDDGTNPTSRT